jgi:adenylate kinase family enzyme
MSAVLDAVLPSDLLKKKLNGELMPDDVVNGVVRNEIHKLTYGSPDPFSEMPSEIGCIPILDGAARTEDQTWFICDSVLSEFNIEEAHFIFFNISAELAIQRITSSPDRKASRRADDRIEIIKGRISRFDQNWPGVKAVIDKSVVNQPNRFFFHTIDTYGSEDEVRQEFAKLMRSIEDKKVPA